MENVKFGYDKEKVEIHDFEKYISLIKSAGGLSLAQVCTISGLEGSTVQNWVKRGFVARPINKKYYEKQLARILLISLLKDGMKIDDIGELMTAVNGDVDDESDDIISEEKLYTCFCDVVGRMDKNTVNRRALEETVKAVTAEYSITAEGASQRLNLVLSVMVNAYLCTKFKKNAEYFFGKLKNINL